ncbi:MAG TPA: hypothetical protein VNV66_00975 [Pilimelia sp.]|nr:hypothetical protein [Pilimelia sp.]
MTTVVTLSVWTFSDPGVASRAARTLRDLAGHRPVPVLDAAAVAWPRDAPRPVAQPVPGLSRDGADYAAVDWHRAGVRRDCSALFVLTTAAVVGRVHDALAAYRPRLRFVRVPGAPTALAAAVVLATPRG